MHVTFQEHAENGAKRMSVVSIMASILEDELRGYGVLGLTPLDCETIVRSIIERTAELKIDSKRCQLGPNPSEKS
jgi:hypothetical protein